MFLAIPLPRVAIVDIESQFGSQVIAANLLSVIYNRSSVHPYNSWIQNSPFQGMRRYRSGPNFEKIMRLSRRLESFFSLTPRLVSVSPPAIMATLPDQP